MSKVYAIKSETGFYYTKSYVKYNDEDKWDDEIYRAFVTKRKELAEKIADEHNKNKKEDEVSCEVVEITIAEGDLEKENRILKSKLYEIWYNFGTIAELCVTESKKEITKSYALEEIRNYLSNIDLCFDEIKEKLGTDYFIKRAKGDYQ